MPLPLRSPRAGSAAVGVVAPGPVQHRGCRAPVPLQMGGVPDAGPHLGVVPGVGQDAVRADPATGAARGRAVVASRFAVEDGVVTAYRRHDDGLPAALAAARSRESGEVTARAG